VDESAGALEYFVLSYDAETMEVRSFTGHGRDFVGAVLDLTSQIEHHRDEPEVVVRLDAAPSFEELPVRHPDLFRVLRFPPATA
jgi:hypothetical protein